MSDLLRAVLRRIDRRQKALRDKTHERVSDRSISLKAGLSADYLRSLRRQYDRGTQIGVTTPAIAAIAKHSKPLPNGCYTVSARKNLAHQKITSSCA